MLLSVKERLVLLQAIPPQTGNLTTLRIVRKFREDLSFDEEEQGRLCFEPDDRGSLSWNAEGAQAKEIEIGETMRKIIVGTLRVLNKAEKLPENCLDIIDKFPEVEEEGE